MRLAFCVLPKSMTVITIEYVVNMNNHRAIAKFTDCANENYHACTVYCNNISISMTKSVSVHWRLSILLFCLALQPTARLCTIGLSVVLVCYGSRSGEHMTCLCLAKSVRFPEGKFSLLLFVCSMPLPMWSVCFWVTNVTWKESVLSDENKANG